MDRLTENGITGLGEKWYKAKGFSAIQQRPFFNIVKRLAEYEDLGLEPSQLKEISPMYQAKCEEVVALKKEVAEYQQKLADGRMVELPCKVGDIVYADSAYFGILDYEINSIQIYKGISYEATASRDDEALDEISIDIEDIGKTVFLTKEEAEQALKEIKIKQSENHCLACGCDCYNSEVGGCEMPSEDLMLSCPLERGDK